MGRAGYQWVVVKTASGADWQVYRTLLKRGYRAELCYYMDDTRRGHYIHGVARPAYPGYLFAEIPEHGGIQALKKIYGVRDVIRDGHGPVYLEEKTVMACSHQWMNGSGPRMSVEARKPIKVGEWIEAPDGAWAGHPCLVESIDQRGYVTASLGRFKATFYMGA